MNSAELAYRKTASEGASGFGMLIALYDTLVGNLRRAADAERSNELEKRCSEVNHALVVIGYLEDCIERASGGDLASKLVKLYAGLRRSLIDAQVERSPEILEQQMNLILSVRESWQTMELSFVSPQFRLAAPSTREDLAHVPTSSRSSGASWSA